MYFKILQNLLTFSIHTKKIWIKLYDVWGLLNNNVEKSVG